MGWPRHFIGWQKEPELFRERAIDYRPASADPGMTACKGSENARHRFELPEPVSLTAPEPDECAKGFKAVCHCPPVSRWNSCCGALSLAPFEKHGFDEDEISVLR